VVRFYSVSRGQQYKSTNDIRISSPRPSR
jgi:hypothetical protein